jgi:copper chaperone
MNMSKKTFTVPNISCKHCTHTIEMELGELSGVTSVKADAASKQVTVEWQEPATWDGIRALLEEINYPAET